MPWNDHNATLQRWPEMKCDGRGVEALLDEGLDAVLSRFDGSPDNDTWINVLAPVIRGLEFMGSVFHNEIYVSWLYRTWEVEYRLCFHHQDFRSTCQKPAANTMVSILLAQTTLPETLDCLHR